MPWVTATEACCGLRPVAKALGESLGITYIFGMGMPIFCVSRSTAAYARGSSSRVTGWARYIFSAILSE